jgi:DNA-binding transcriptional MerR regulator
MVKIKGREYFNAKEISQLFNVNYSNLTYWRKKGLNHIKVSQKKHLYLKEDVEKFLLGGQS